MADVVSDLKQSGFRGEVLEQDSAGYEQSIHVWGISPKGNLSKPRYALRPRGTQDCSLAVKWARKHKLDLAAKAGGHSAANLALIEGGVLLDLCLLRGVTVDPEQRTASIQGGALLADVDSETGLFNLATPLGHAPPTGIGLALNGGFGIASRAFGLSCSNILSCTLVTAEGDVETVNSQSHPELLWALRGAASAYGIVTNMVMQLHDVSNFYGGFIMWPDDPEHNNWRKISRWQRDVAFKYPGFDVPLYWTRSPQGPALAAMVSFFGDEPAEEKARLCAPLKEIPTIMDTVGQWTYAQTQNSFAPMMAMAKQHYEYPVFAYLPVHQVTDEFLEDFLKEVVDQVPAELTNTLVAFDIMGGKAVEHDGPTGIGKGADFYALALVGWTDPKHNDLGMSFSRKVRKLITGAGGTSDCYSNIVMESDAKLATRCGGEDNLARMRKLKHQWDPTNFFKAHPYAGL